MGLSLASSALTFGYSTFIFSVRHRIILVFYVNGAECDLFSVLKI